MMMYQINVHQCAIVCVSVIYITLVLGLLLFGGACYVLNATGGLFSLWCESFFICKLFSKFSFYLHSWSFSFFWILVRNVYSFLTLIHLQPEVRAALLSSLCWMDGSYLDLLLQFSIVYICYIIIFFPFVPWGKRARLCFLFFFFYGVGEGIVDLISHK